MLADPERAEDTNPAAAHRCGAARRRVVPSWLPRAIAHRLQSRKVRIAARNIRRANRGARIDAVPRNFLEADVAARFTDCDFLFLAADTMGARLLFNAIVHQYGVPGIQVGAKTPGCGGWAVGNVFCVSRMVTPEQGCLWCNGLISPGRLQDEAVPEAVRRGYCVCDDPDVAAPSVVTMNAIACAHAADDFLFHLTGLKYRRR